jgi:hypothetical protein
MPYAATSDAAIAGMVSSTKVSCRTGESQAKQEPFSFEP